MLVTPIPSGSSANPLHRSAVIAACCVSIGYSPYFFVRSSLLVGVSVRTSCLVCDGVHIHVVLELLQMSLLGLNLVLECLEPVVQSPLAVISCHE